MTLNLAASVRNVKTLPVAANVCEQVLREVERNPEWSLAHVTMNPLATSLRHSHAKMTEIYVVTKGSGELTISIDKNEISPTRTKLVAGSVVEIPAGVQHMFRNLSGGHLEHFVFALPPFDPSDVQIFSESKYEYPFDYGPALPKVEDCFDGAKILPYDLSHLNLSIAFGWVNNDKTRRKRPHYHKETTEYVYVVEGKGEVVIDGSAQPIEAGDWIRINPHTSHGLLNHSPEDLVVVCICSPAFKMDDVHYR